MEPEDKMPGYIPTSSSLDELKEYEKARDEHRKETADAAIEHWRKAADAALRGTAVHEGFSLTSGSSGSSGTFVLTPGTDSSSVLSTTPGTGTTFIDFRTIVDPTLSPYIPYTPRPYVGGADPYKDDLVSTTETESSKTSRLDKIEHQMKFQREARLLTEEEFVEYADELENCKIALDSVDKTISYYKDKKDEVENRIKALKVLFEVHDEEFEGEVTRKTPEELKAMVYDAMHTSLVSPEPGTIQSNLEHAIHNWYINSSGPPFNVQKLRIVMSHLSVTTLIRELNASSALTIEIDSKGVISYRGIKIIRSYDLHENEFLITEAP